MHSFLLNNQPDALIIQIYSVIKILHVSGIFSTHHQEFFYCTFGTGNSHAGFGDSFQADSGWNCSSILTLLGSGHQNLHETYQCRMNSKKLLMMGREDTRNM